MFRQRSLNRCWTFICLSLLWLVAPMLHAATTQPAGKPMLTGVDLPGGIAEAPAGEQTADFAPTGAPLCDAGRHFGSGAVKGARAKPSAATPPAARPRR